MRKFPCSGSVNLGKVRHRITYLVKLYALSVVRLECKLAGHRELHLQPPLYKRKMGSILRTVQLLRVTSVAGNMVLLTSGYITASPQEPVLQSCSPNKSQKNAGFYFFFFLPKTVQVSQTGLDDGLHSPSANSFINVYLRPACPALNSLGRRLRKSSSPPGEIMRGICAYQRQQYGCWLQRHYLCERGTESPKTQGIRWTFFLSSL